MRNELKNRLNQLHQRHKAADTINFLPESFLEGIDLNRLSYKEDIYSTHGLELFPKGVAGQYIYPTGYSLYEYVEVDQIAHLVRNIKRSRLIFDDEIFVSLDNDSGFWPLKHQIIDKFISWYVSYIKSSYQTLAIFQADYKKGIMVSNYCGYLPEDLRTNSNEIVYEYIEWEKI